MRSSNVLLLLLMLVFAGCGGGGEDAVTVKQKALVSMSVTPTASSLPLGTTQQFTATATFADGSSQDLTSTASWSSANPAVATISNSGLAISVGTGGTEISATSGTVTASATLTVIPPTLVSIVVTPANANVAMGETLQFIATGTSSDQTTRDLTQSVDWSSSAPAIVSIGSAAGLFGKASPVATGTTTIRAASGTISGSTTLTVNAEATAENNVLPITVNGALCSANSYPNKPCVSVTVCIPGTTTCKTISDILLDTGSFGLRLFTQPLGLDLPAAPGAAGALAECIQFADGSSEWGPIRIASVILGGQPQVEVPIHVFDTTFAPPPASCLNADSGPAAAGFNGILGVGLFAQDCGSRCASSAANGMYFSCSGASCSGTAVAITNQVKNPVAFLPLDNNGILVQLPDVPAEGAPAIDGRLILGVGTQPNNNPAAVQAFVVNQFGEITTIFDGIPTGSFIDSGSNGLFFPQPSQPALPVCSPPFSAWYCPPTETPLVATTVAASGLPTAEIPFRTGNFINLNSTGNRVFDNIGGPFHGGIFDWGLPFFLGRNIFIGIEGKNTSLGQGPFWAF